jgi:hypothetical protein
MFFCSPFPSEFLRFLQFRHHGINFYLHYIPFNISQTVDYILLFSPIVSLKLLANIPMDVAADKYRRKRMLITSNVITQQIRLYWLLKPFSKEYLRQLLQSQPTHYFFNGRTVTTDE